MNILVTAGNTQVLIDQVRCLTNVFTGRTGAAIALCAASRGHTVCLATSHPEAIDDLAPEFGPPEGDRLTCHPYRTFEDLQTLLAERIPGGGFDAIIHCAAVSDYLSGGVFAPAHLTRFDPLLASWHTLRGDPRMQDRSAGKINSAEPELWLRLVRAPKLIDRMRADWNFRGVLVKFKLEVGITWETLLDIAEPSRQVSQADLMVANTLEGASAWALMGPFGTDYHRVARADLPARLLDAVEALYREKTHG